MARRLDEVPALLDGDAGGVLVFDAAEVRAEALRLLLAPPHGLTCIAIDFAGQQGGDHLRPAPPADDAGGTGAVD